ncbi:hypothetical protein [Microbacterium lacus]|uniref:hypothetical protein n=1 Tax=Microbacterium lacus TaxID=415217 RepID=UPI000C2CD9D8|nr:hypothetical protein [Microbacterium lacus]
MNISKQFVTLIGAVLAVGILAAGVFLIALPLAGQASATTTDADMVAQTNLGYETQIAGLRESEADLAEIEASVAELQREIPAEPHLDDIFEIVATAANTAGVSIVTASIGDTTAWTPRAALTSDSLVFTDGASDSSDPAVTDGATETGDATTDETPTDGSVTDGATPPTEPKVQIGFTVTLISPSPAQAQLFIDALGDGNRLVSIVHSTLSPNTTAYDLTVNATAFVRTEN